MKRWLSTPFKRALHRRPVELAMFLGGWITMSECCQDKLGDKWPAFREELIKLFTEAKGEELYGAVESMYELGKEAPETSQLFRMVMKSCENAAAREELGSIEEMLILRDRLLRRLEHTEWEGPQIVAATQGNGFVAVPVYYCTDRNVLKPRALGKKSVKRYFGNSRGDDLHWGVMHVSVPDGLGYGPTCRWPYSPTRKNAPPAKLVHLNTIPIPVNNICCKVKHMGANGSMKKEAIIFVHGYNCSLADGVRRMAQVAYFADFSGPVFAYSWPSTQTVSGYTADEANVMWSISHFDTFLRRIMSDCGLERVHLLAHSMGSRCIIYALLRLYIRKLPAHAAQIGRVVLAAPDFDMGEFMLMAEEVARNCESITLYCSAEDQALHLSRTVHGGYPRLGDSRGLMELRDKGGSAIGTVLGKLMDAVDTTGTDSSWTRHSYLFTKCHIIQDACKVLTHGWRPHERGGLHAHMQSLSGSEVFYWTFSLQSLPRAVSAKEDGSTSSTRRSSMAKSLRLTLPQLSYTRRSRRTPSSIGEAAAEPGSAEKTQPALGRSRTKRYVIEVNEAGEVEQIEEEEESQTISPTLAGRMFNKTFMHLDSTSSTTSDLSAELELDEEAEELRVDYGLLDEEKTQEFYAQFATTSGKPSSLDAGLVAVAKGLVAAGGVAPGSDEAESKVRLEESGSDGTDPWGKERKESNSGGGRTLALAAAAAAAVAAVSLEEAGVRGTGEGDEDDDAGELTQSQRPAMLTSAERRLLKSTSSRITAVM